MSKSIADAIGAVGRPESYLMCPDRIIIVTDRESPIYDERVDPEIGLGLDEEMVLDVMERGVTDAIDCRRNGRWPDGDDKLEVVDGRQRLLHLREANRRRVVAGQPPMQIVVKIATGTNRQLFDMMVRSNEFRRSDTPVILAHKMLRARDKLGYAMEEIAATFKVKTVARVERYLRLLDLHPELQKAAGHGVPMKTLLELASFTQSEQPAELQKLRDAGLLRGPAVAAAVAAASGVTSHRPPSAAGPKRPTAGWLKSVEGGAKETLFRSGSSKGEVGYAEGLRDAMMALRGDEDARRRLDVWAALDPATAEKAKKASLKVSKSLAASKGKAATGKGKKRSA